MTEKNENLAKGKKRGRKKDITGKRFGMLVAMYPVEERSSSGSIKWKCLCDCGNETEVSVSDLQKGNNKSCGCLKKQYQRMVHDRLHLIDGTCVEWLGKRKDRSDNRSGFRGVFKKKNGKYSVSIGFKKKLYYIGTFDEFEDAVQARIGAEKLIHGGFVEAYTRWQQKADKDQQWGKEHPFKFDIEKVNGEIVVRISGTTQDIEEKEEEDES